MYMPKQLTKQVQPGSQTCLRVEDNWDKNGTIILPLKSTQKFYDFPILAISSRPRLQNTQALQFSAKGASEKSWFSNFLRRNVSEAFEQLDAELGCLNVSLNCLIMLGALRRQNLL